MKFDLEICRTHTLQVTLRKTTPSARERHASAFASGTARAAPRPLPNRLTGCRPVAPPVLQYSIAYTLTDCIQPVELSLCQGMRSVCFVLNIGVRNMIDTAHTYYQGERSGAVLVGIIGVGLPLLGLFSS